MAGPEDVEEGELASVPNMRDVDASPMCFLNADRGCGAECLAYVTHPKLAQSSELTVEQAHCALINNAERCGRGVIMASKAMSDVAVKLHSLVARSKTREADRERTSQFQDTATRSPFGGGGQGDKKP